MHWSAGFDDQWTVNSGPARWNTAQGKVCEKEHGTSMPSPGVPFSPCLHMVTNQEAPVATF